MPSSSAGSTGLARYASNPAPRQRAVFLAGVGGEGEGGDGAAERRRELAQDADQVVAVLGRHRDVADDHVRAFAGDRRPAPRGRSRRCVGIAPARARMRAITSRASGSSSTTTMRRPVRSAASGDSRASRPSPGRVSLRGGRRGVGDAGVATVATGRGPPDSAWAASAAAAALRRSGRRRASSPRGRRSSARAASRRTSRRALRPRSRRARCRRAARRCAARSSARCRARRARACSMLSAWRKRSKT